MGLIDKIRAAIRGDSGPEQTLPQRVVAASVAELSYSQLDITEGFGDDVELGPDDWISTTPLNASVQDPTAVGLPPVGASDDEVYEVGSGLSEIRESVSIQNDGVYCPVCHIANTELAKLRSPCPRCGRPLLEFGWD
jgi:hypothetical protein